MTMNPDMMSDDEEQEEEDMEQKMAEMQAESDLRLLIEAEKIKADKERMAGVRASKKRMMDEMKKVGS